MFIHWYWANTLRGSMRFLKVRLLKRCVRWLVLGCLCCSLVAPVWALEIGTKFWFPLVLNGNYGDLLYHVQGQLRFIERTNIFNQYIGYAAIGRQTSPEWQAWFGQTISTTAQDAVAGSAEEYRSWEQLVWQRDIRKVHVYAQTRMEERKSLEFPQWAFRIRELIWLTIPVASNFAVEFQNELFYNFNRVPYLYPLVYLVQKDLQRYEVSLASLQQMLSYTVLTFLLSLQTT